jgi:hypothetical protein
MKKTIMPLGKDIDFSDYRDFANIFIETGTCFGRTVDLALNAGYEHIRSVELHPHWFEVSRKKFAENPKVKLYFGKSTDLLPEMLSDITDRCVFWLDAHPSGDHTAGHSDVVENGTASEFFQDNIIKKELSIVLAHRNDHVICIDDQNAGHEDETMGYVEIIAKANPNYEFFLLDEQMGENHYEKKILVAIP